MRAVKFLGRERVSVREYPNPEPQEGQVVVRIRASALCGSELHAYRGEQALESNPGHEPAGIIVDASRSRRWRKGDRWASTRCGAAAPASGASAACSPSATRSCSARVRTPS